MQFFDFLFEAHFVLTFFYLKKRYYEIPSSEDSYKARVDTVSQNNLTKLRALSYGVAVIVIVSKGKAVKNT